MSGSNPGQSKGWKRCRDIKNISNIRKELIEIPFSHSFPSPLHPDMMRMEKYVELVGQLEGKKTTKKTLQNETQEHSDMEAGRCWCSRDLRAFLVK